MKRLLLSYAPYQYDPHPYIGIFLWMNAIQTFNFHSKEVRTATDLNGDVYFALLMLQMFSKSVMPIQAVLILMKLVYIKCISATQVVQNK